MYTDLYLYSLSKHPKANSINSLEVELLHPEIDFSKYDALILTSKQAVEALKQYKNFPKESLPALCISKKTAQAYEEFGGTVVETASGYGAKISELLRKHPKDMKWLYLRAKTVATEFVKELQNDSYVIDEKIVYVSRCSKEIAQQKPQENATLIFTSPSSIECFVQHHNLDESYTIIVIGKTTAKALPKGLSYTIAHENTIESCVECYEQKLLK